MNRHITRIRNMIGIHIVAMAMGALVATSSAIAAPPVANGMMPDWVDDVLDVIEEVEESLEDAASLVPTGSGTVPPADLSDFNDHLDKTLDLIDDLFDTSTYPSLIAVGSVDTSVDPYSLRDYADDTTILAGVAVTEVLNGSGFSQTLVADQLRTMRHLIERTGRNYRNTAE